MMMLLTAVAIILLTATTSSSFVSMFLQRGCMAFQCHSKSSHSYHSRHRRASSPTAITSSSSLYLASSSSSSSSAEDPVISRLDNIRRVYCLSDLHTDHVLNLEWLRKRMEKTEKNCTLGSQDLLVIAGDISHDEETFAETIQCLQSTNCQVVFVVGNHEAWLTKEERDAGIDSIQKLESVYQVCREYGVIVDPCYIPDETNPLIILPMQSWYDGSLSFNEEFCKGFEYWPWVDFIRCQWPKQFDNVDGGSDSRIPVGLVEDFHTKSNLPNIHNVQEVLEQDPSISLLTVSHFLPNLQSLPDWKDLEATEFDLDTWLDHGGREISAKFAKVAGSALIDEQLRTILPRTTTQSTSTRDHIHVFGHSHRPKDFTYEGIRYLHNPLGKPRERQLHLIAPDVDFQLVWDFDSTNDSGGGQVEGETILRYWDEKAGGKEKLWERMQKVRPGRYGLKYKQRRERISALRAAADNGSKNNNIQKND